MNTKDLTLSQTEIHKLLSAGSGDAALLHLYLQCGNAPREAEAALGPMPCPQGVWQRTSSRTDRSW